MSDKQFQYKHLHFLTNFALGPKFLDVISKITQNLKINVTATYFQTSFRIQKRAIFAPRKLVLVQRLSSEMSTKYSARTLKLWKRKHQRPSNGAGQFSNRACMWRPSTKILFRRLLRPCRMRPAILPGAALGSRVLALH